MVIFHSYVSLPEGTVYGCDHGCVSNFFGELGKSSSTCDPGVAGFAVDGILEVEPTHLGPLDGHLEGLGFHWEILRPPNVHLI